MTVVIIVTAILLVAMVFACCKVSGDCSRQEEQEYWLRPCPRCKKRPRLSYCRGKYFVAGDDPDCPYCGTAFTEMHASPKLEVDAWNRRVRNG